MFTFIVYPSRLVEMPAMHHEIEAMVDYVKASPSVSDLEPVLVPDDKESISFGRRLKEGIPVYETAWELILE